METDIKNTVALDTRRIGPAQKSGPAVSQTTSSTQQTAPVDAAQKSTGTVPGTQPQDTASLDQAVRDLNGYVQNVQRNLQFDVDDQSGHTVIRVVDSETEEVIRQMPSEEVLTLARHLKELNDGGQGLFLKEKA